LGSGKFEIGIRKFEVGIRKFEVGIRKFEVGIRKFEVGIRKFEIGIRPTSRKATSDGEIQKLALKAKRLQRVKSFRVGNPWLPY